MPTPVNISGSRASTILGVNNYQSQLNVWLQIKEELNPGFCKKHGYELPVFEYNTQMQFGHKFEDSIVKKYEGVNNVKIKNREKLFIKNDNLSCHVDGIIDDILIENKTTSIMYYRDNFGEPETDKIPLTYQIQVQHNMLVTGLKSCIMPVLVFPERVDKYIESEIITIDTINPDKWIDVLYEMGNLYIYNIKPLPELQQKMLDRYAEFWQVNVLDGVMPEPSNYDDIKAVYREPVGTVVADERITALMAEYKDIKAEISNTGDLAKKCEEIKTEVLNYMRLQDSVLDDESRDKTMLRGPDGKKLAQYGKNKNGAYMFR